MHCVTRSLRLCASRRIAAAPQRVGIVRRARFSSGRLAQTQHTPGLVQAHFLETNRVADAVKFYARIFPEWEITQDWGSTPSATVKIAGRAHFFITQPPPHPNPPASSTSSSTSTAVASPGVAAQWLPVITDSYRHSPSPFAEIAALGGVGYVPDVHNHNLSGLPRGACKRVWDSQGAQFLLAPPPGTDAAIQALRLPPTSLPFPAGAANWQDICATDVNKSLEFYTKLFDWRHYSAESSGTPYFCVSHRSQPLHTNAYKIAGILPRSALFPNPLPSEAGRAFWLTFFQVAASEFEARTQLVKSQGGSVVVPPTKTKDGTFTILRDHEGAPFALFDRTDQ